MTQLRQEELMKNRNYGATIKAAYSLFVDNYRAIFRHLWPFALVMAALMGFYVLFQIRSIGHEPSVSHLLMMVPLMMVLFAAEIAFYARLMSLVDGKSTPWNLWRVIKCGLWLLLIILIPSLIIGGISGYSTAIVQQRTLEAPAENMEMVAAAAQHTMTLAMIVCMAVALVFVLLFLPYQYAVMKYFMEPATHFRKLIFKGYTTGMRHWGYIFLTMLITILCTTIVGIVFSLPLIIAILAYYLSVAGQLAGDEAGVPGYFNALVYVISTLTYFVYLFMGAFTMFVGYYIYGTIETREQEKLAL